MSARNRKQEALAAVPTLDHGNQSGRKNKVLGHSACAIAKALGRAGIKLEEADRILRGHGVEMSRASLSVQLGFGRNPATWEKRGQPAPLTGEQIAELRKVIGE